MFLCPLWAQPALFLAVMSYWHTWSTPLHHCSNALLPYWHSQCLQLTFCLHGVNSSVFSVAVDQCFDQQGLILFVKGANWKAVNDQWHSGDLHCSHKGAVFYKRLLFVNSSMRLCREQEYGDLFSRGECVRGKYLMLLIWHAPKRTQMQDVGLSSEHLLLRVDSK